MNKLILVVVFFSLSLTTFSYAQTKTSQKEMLQATYESSKAIVKTQNFQFIGELVFNGQQRERVEGDLNTVHINKSEVSGGIKTLSESNQTIEFLGSLENYNVSYDDDNQIISIDFRLNNQALHINIKPNGKVHLTTNLNIANGLVWIGRLVKI